MKLKYIDALRGIAVILVMVAHTFQYSTSFSDGIFNKLVAHGARGVQLFFIVSAFTLFLSFNLRMKKEKKVNLKFFIRRFFRIAPLYYLGILYFLYQDGFGARYWLGDAESITITNVFSNILFLNDFNPYWITSVVPGGWSIGVEMTFYMIVPLLVNNIKSLCKAVNFTLISIVLSLLLYIFLKNNVLISSLRLWDEYLFFYFPNQLPVFGFGIILYFLIIKKDYKLNSINYVTGLITLVMLLFFKNHIHSNLPFALLFSIFIYVLSKIDLKIFVNRFTVFMGNISYSAYLVHFALLHWMGEYEFLNFLNVNTYSNYIINFVLNFLLVCILTTIISYFSYVLLEKRFINYGKQIIQKID